LSSTRCWRRSSRNAAGLRVPAGGTGFEIAVRAVLGQQMTVRSATQLAGDVVAAIGTPVADGTESRD
jgi:AraC family transcriptional regulator of adaptative response / DNA-3-methyladenine glycosylase II